MLPYLGGIGVFLVAIWKWVFDALKEERDHFQKKSELQEKETDKLKEKNLHFQRKIDEKQILINSYIKELQKRMFFLMEVKMIKVERLKKELTKLNTKRNKLSKFLSKQNKKMVSANQFELLKEQKRVMARYAKILQLRINDLKEDE